MFFSFRHFGLALLAVVLGSGDAVSQLNPVVAPASLHVNPANLKREKVVGLTPAAVRRAYGFDRVANQGSYNGTPQTIAIIVAFDNPTIEHDLSVFSTTFDLPACTSANGCFQKVSNAGAPPPDPALFPAWFVELWQLEAALDVQWAHAMAPEARKVLVQADTAFLADLLAAVDQGVAAGASVVSMSWGLPESRDRELEERHFLQSNVSFVAASGDTGSPGLWPATSPDVTAVGGTSLNINSSGESMAEQSWSESGGGLSHFNLAAACQLPFTPENPAGKRGVPDVSYHADPNQGFAVFSSTYGGSAGWTQVGGTSAGAPQWSALIAISNALRSAANKPPLTGANAALYGAASAAYGENYNDIVSGPMNSNYSVCGSLCRLRPGYDYVTGLGSPKADQLVPALVLQ